MTSEYESLFNSQIIAPLQRVVGRLLVDVNYYILWGEFDPETPNECGGCQGIHLVFDGAEVEFDWDAKHPFRKDGGIAYHLTVSDHSMSRKAVRDWTAEDISGLNLVPVTETQLWRGLVGEPLMRVEVLGERLDESRYSPQTARLHFLSGLIVVAIGMTELGARSVDVGDGDEVLVFDEQTWVALPNPGPSGLGPFTLCWHWPK